MGRLSRALLLILCLLVPAGAPARAPADHNRPVQSADTAFAALSKRYVEGILRLDPSHATALGDHRFDSEVTDMSSAGRARAMAFYRQLLAQLGRIDRKRLSRENQVDAALLDNALRYGLWTNDTLQDWAWDAQIYTETAGTSLFSLAARDFAPWPERLRSATARMEKIPQLLAQARARLVPARVPAIYATTVQKQNAGITSIVDEMLLPHRNSLPAAEAARFDAAYAKLKASVTGHQKWLDTVLVPKAGGDFRLGPRLYDQKVRFALESPLTRREIKARATRAVAQTRAEMYRVAGQLLAGRPNAPALPEQPSADQQQKAIEAALELSYANVPPRDGVMAAAADALRKTTAFVAKANFVTMPTSPVKIVPTPEYMRGVAVAYCDSPGPLDKELATFFMVSPLPADWTDAQVASFLREYNSSMLHDLTAHEAMPGHYLQGFHANRSQSLLRAVLASGPFVEGWAVYGEGMMADLGYLNGDPLFRLSVLKMRLRAIVNSLLDIGIQTEGMTREQAMDLMTRTAFQQEREASGKWTRATLGSTQLLSYFAGYSEIMELREEAKRHQGASFSLKSFNDALLAHGSPPVKYVRALMFGEPILQ
jgi:uncharacterized protein (DUF885 family)